MSVEPTPSAGAFSLGGCASRRRAWIVFLIFAAVFAAVQAPGLRAALGGHVLFPALGLALVVWLFTAVQRLHDAGRTGAWALLVSIPLIGLLASLVILLLRPRPGVTRKGHPRLRTLFGIGLVAVLVLMLSRAWWSPYWISSGSMKPALLPGDYMIATPVAAGAVRRGLVVLYRHPTRNVIFVSRVIGLPGDTVQMKAGRLYLNGTEVPRAAEGEFEEAMAPQGPGRSIPRCANAPVGMGGTCLKARWRETLPDGPAFDILTIPDGGYANNTRVFTVPKGHVFVMGDNRDNAMDSRFPTGAGGPGFIPVANLVGRARLVLFSAGGAALEDVGSWRPDRYFRRVQ